MLDGDGEIYCEFIELFAKITKDTISGRAGSPMVMRDQERDQELVDTNTFNLNASDGFGSLLMQMQIKEKELLAKNQSIATLNLDPLPPKTDADEMVDAAATDQTPIDVIDYETAKSLDDAVIPLTGDLDAIRATTKVLPLDPLYQSQLDQRSSKTTADSPPSRQEPYQVRIGRDKKQVAATIATSADSAAQWRLFCQESGGLYPLLETIREGAQAIMQEYSMTEPDTWLQGKKEESLLACSNACRAIRDVCAVSPEVAAIVTDGILRTNAAWNGGVLNDFCTLLEYANDYTEAKTSKKMKDSPFRLLRRNKREIRVRCMLYLTQLILAMTFASDDAVRFIRSADGLSAAVLACSSYARKEKRRRWLRYPGEIVKFFWRKEIEKSDSARNPFLEAAKIKDTLEGQVQKTANLVLAAIGCNHWIPKIAGQKGLRILCLDGGGSRGVSAVTALNKLIDYAGDGAQPADSFDIICGTSTGGIISFLTGLRGESSQQAVER
jgi:hypothetical protein